MKTWTSGGLAPEKGTRPAKAVESSRLRDGRLRFPIAYLLALVWVVVGAALYAIEIARLVSGHG